VHRWLSTITPSKSKTTPRSTQFTLIFDIEIVLAKFLARPDKSLTFGTDIVGGSRIRIIPPVGYLDSPCLLSRATVVLAGSGGIQEETTPLWSALLYAQEERRATRDSFRRTKVLVGTDPRRFSSHCGCPRWEEQGGMPTAALGRQAAERVLVILLQSLPEEEAALAISQ